MRIPQKVSKCKGFPKFANFKRLQLGLWCRISEISAACRGDQAAEPRAAEPGPQPVQRLRCQILWGSFSAVSKPIFATKYSFFFSILRDLQDLHTFAPLESQVENYLEKNLPENPKENERTRPHGKVEKEETTREAWNSAETMRRTTAERRAAAENIFVHFRAFSCISMHFHSGACNFREFETFSCILKHFRAVPKLTKGHSAEPASIFLQFQK